MLPPNQVAHKLQRDLEVSVAAFAEELKATSEGMTVSRHGVQQSSLSTSVLSGSLRRSRRHRKSETDAGLAKRAAVSKKQRAHRDAVAAEEQQKLAENALENQLEVEAEIHVEEAIKVQRSRTRFRRRGSHFRNSNTKQTPF